MSFYKNDKEARSNSCEVGGTHFHEEVDARGKTYYRILFEDCKIIEDEKSCFWLCMFNKCERIKKEINH